MKDVWPEFADKVDFYAIGQDPNESLELMERYRQEQGYPWPVAETNRETLGSLGVLQSSTKVAVDGRYENVAFDIVGMLESFRQRDYRCDTGVGTVEYLNPLVA